MSDVQVRELRLPDDLDRIADLHNANRPRHSGRRRFEWAYLDNPAGHARVWGAEDAGVLVGIAAVFPRALQLATGERVVAWTTGDLSVATSHRRRGIAQSLRDEARKGVDAGEAACLFTLPNPAAARVHARVGFTALGHMTTLVRPLAVPGPRWWRRATGLVIDWWLAPSAGAALQTTSISDVTTPDRLGEIDTLYDRVSGGLGTSLVRTGAYAQWRFLANAKAPADLLLARDERQLRGYAAVAFRGRSLHLRDWLSDGPEVLRTLVAEAAALARRAGMAWVSVAALEGHRDIDVLRTAGFRHRGTGTAVKVYVADGSPWASAVRSPGAWYLTGGDPDV